ncbi:hypothetical protein [Streptomyces sp. OM5714]|uniref:hypothetical protein n=1 Tax=Streptomyces sp. OM5714 TaxID=2602736 RepID=UPI0013DB2147|nr:hypothetical protein [Streptomyces sp. OM5714]
MGGLAFEGKVGGVGGVQGLPVVEADLSAGEQDVEVGAACRYRAGRCPGRVGQRRTAMSALWPGVRVAPARGVVKSAAGRTRVPVQSMTIMLSSPAAVSRPGPMPTITVPPMRTSAFCQSPSSGLPVMTVPPVSSSGRPCGARSSGSRSS